MNSSSTIQHNFSSLHNHNFQISDTASNKLHTATQSQLTAPAEWYKHSSQLVSSVIITVGSPTDPHQLTHKLEMHESSKSRRYSCLFVQKQETWGLDKQLHTFLFPALHSGKWSASCHGHFTTSLKYSVNKRLGGSQTQSGCFGEENYLLPLHNNSMVIHHTAWTLNQ